MARAQFVTVNVRPETKKELDDFRKTATEWRDESVQVTLTYDEALKRLLKHWRRTH